MKRQAILIGAPGSSYSLNYLHGVEFDIKNYIKFLKSPSGGAWNNSEIMSVMNPDKEKLLKLVKTIKADYVLTFFCGHGKQSLTGHTKLAINKTEHLTLANLATKAPKQMFVVDACRSFAELRSFGYLDGEFQNIPSCLTKKQARIIYDDYLKICENGTAICYSCSIGEISLELNDGGFFTTSLLNQTQQWVESPSELEILPVSLALELAKKQLLINFGSAQTPQLRTKQDRQFWFPFAVKKATLPHPKIHLEYDINKLYK